MPEVVETYLGPVLADAVFNCKQCPCCGASGDQATAVAQPCCQGSTADAVVALALGQGSIQAVWRYVLRMWRFEWEPWRFGLHNATAETLVLTGTGHLWRLWRFLWSFSSSVLGTDGWSQIHIVERVAAAAAADGSLFLPQAPVGIP
jgi:hypothetical protein